MTERSLSVGNGRPDSLPLKGGGSGTVATFDKNGNMEWTQ
jgi:hypothetical protein